MPDAILAARPALPQLHAGQRFGRPDGPAGVRVAELTGVALATVAPRRGQRDALRAALHHATGILPPDGMRVAFADGVAIAAAERGAWLVASYRGADVARLCRDIAHDRAAVVDQSDGRALLRLGGPRLLDTLAKGLEIDLHPRAFRTGDVALTALSHLAVQLWKRDDAPVVELLVPRPAAGDIWHWLQESAAEFGLEVAAAGPA